MSTLEQCDITTLFGLETNIKISWDLGALFCVFSILNTPCSMSIT